MTLPTDDQLRVDVLGPLHHPSPLEQRKRFVDECERILLCSSTVELESLAARGG